MAERAESPEADRGEERDEAVEAVERQLFELVRGVCSLARERCDYASVTEALQAAPVYIVAAAERLLSHPFRGGVAAVLHELRLVSGEPGSGLEDVFDNLSLVEADHIDEGDPLDTALLLDALLKVAEVLDGAGGDFDAPEDAPAPSRREAPAEDAIPAPSRSVAPAEEADALELLRAVQEVTQLLAELHEEDRAEAGLPPLPASSPRQHWRPPSLTSSPAQQLRRRPPPRVSSPPPYELPPPPLPPPRAPSSFGSAASVRLAAERAARVAAARKIYAAVPLLNLPPPPRPPRSRPPQPPPPRRISVLDLIPTHTHGLQPRPRTAPRPRRLHSET